MGVNASERGWASSWSPNFFNGTRSLDPAPPEMYEANFFHICAIVVSCAYGYHLRIKPANEESADVNVFFDQLENVMENVVQDPKTQAVVEPNPNSNQIVYSVIEGERSKQPDKSIYSYVNLLTEAPAKNFGISPFQNPPMYSRDEAERKNRFLDFERYQEFVFRPLHACDRYDSSQRSCIFYRQLGTTLTVGIYMGEGPHSGINIYWYRCLKKKQDNIIKEPLSQTFLPWNLNLGGTGNELRISPITEMDLGNNYFLAELVMPRAYREKYGKKPSIRFTIEPISINMGTLYHGEEIVIYARSFMELPWRSVNFKWSLFYSNEPEDLGLPSNMRLNSDRSSVVIKELRTHQDQILTCKAYSNKGVLIARRNFLFKGVSRNNSTDRSNTRHKRSIDDTEEAGESDRMEAATDKSSPNPGQYDSKTLHRNTRFEWDAKVPEIPIDLFYDRGQTQDSALTMREPHNRFLRSDDFNTFPPEDIPADGYKNNILKETIGSNKFQRSEEFPIMDDPKTSHLWEKHRFEDVDSQTIATCLSDLDCNIYAVCIPAPLSGQKFCKCRHDYNGNGIFCFIY